VDFKWPSAADLLKMPTNQPIRALKIRWKANSKSTNYIGGVQIVLSNGHSSPVFLGKAQDDKNMQEVVITPGIRKLRGTNANSYIRQVSFLDENNNEILKIYTE
jgi:hypothetical protein